MEISSQSDDRMNPTNIHPSSMKWISQKMLAQPNLLHQLTKSLSYVDPCSLKWLLLASKVCGVRSRLYGMMQFLSKPFSALQLPHQLQPVVGGLSFSFQIVEQLLAMEQLLAIDKKQSYDEHKALDQELELEHNIKKVCLSLIFSIHIMANAQT